MPKRPPATAAACLAVSSADPPPTPMTTGAATARTGIGGGVDRMRRRLAGGHRVQTGSRRSRRAPPARAPRIRGARPPRRPRPRPSAGRTFRWVGRAGRGTTFPRRPSELDRRRASGPDRRDRRDPSRRLTVHLSRDLVLLAWSHDIMVRPAVGAASFAHAGNGGGTQWTGSVSIGCVVKSDPVHLDLVESYARGKISRRDFVRRGTIIGLSAPFIGAVIAAIGRRRGSGTIAGAGRHPGAPARAGHDQRRRRSGSPTRHPPRRPIRSLMQDLGAYGLIAQCFEFLITLGEDGEIAPGLAESWEPNEDGTVWTFQLRQGVTWQADGSPFTSADVAATMDRLVEAGNAGAAGRDRRRRRRRQRPQRRRVHPRGRRTATSRTWCRCSTPRRRSRRSTTRSAPRSTRSPNGTGPWKLTSFDSATGATFERNPDWWGGQTPLDGQEVQFFSDLGTMVTAMQGGAADAIVQFSVIGGDALLNSPDFTVLEIESTTHRQIWMGCSEGQFVEKAARQALAFTFDREQMVSTLFQGRGVIANDHIIAPFMPFFNDSVPQRTPGRRAGQGAARRSRVSGRAPGGAPRRRPAGDPRAGPADPGRGGRGRDRAGDRRGERRHVLRHTVVPARRRPAVRRRRRARHRRLRPPADARTCSSTPRSRPAACGTRRSTPTPSSTPRSRSTRRRSASRPRRRRPGRWRRS